ncbi:MAG: FG-GAP-like repeat-containing protein, partial [Pyrinomonadaceae bacterium]
VTLTDDHSVDLPPFTTLATAATNTAFRGIALAPASGAPTPTPQADLAITKTDGVTDVVPGGSTTYTITASNAGPDAVTGANVADTFPAALTDTWTCVGAGGGTCTAAGAGNINDTVNLPSGGSVTYTASAAISAAATGTLSNTATVTAPAGTTDPTPGNNSATDVDTVTPQADLAITKTDGVTTANAGTSVVYTITASNTGPSNVTGATVADTFPATLTATWTCAGAGGGTCTAAGAGNINDSTVNLPAGGSVTYTAAAQISIGATGTLSNTATVTSGVTDPTPGNNSATDTDTIVAHVVRPAQVDMNGDGFTDFVQVRATGSPFSGNSAAPGSNIPRFMGARGKVKYFAQHPNAVATGAQFQQYWYVSDNLTASGYGVAWGDAAIDWNVPADYDGDGRTDVAVWRTGAPGEALFYVIRSSDFTVMFQNFGQAGDDPTVVADYDGDGIADMAVFSCPSSPGPCSFNYIGTKDNPSGSVTSVSWGTGTPGSLSPIAGDYDGDKKADFCVYREDPAIPGQGQYALHKSDGSADEFVDWGLYNEDIVVPGDFDGDGKADFMVIRDTHPQYVFYLLTRTGQVSSYDWGITGDVPTPGDYDGDGKTDVAVWRPSANLSDDWFYVINSHDGSVQGRVWGQCTTAPCDEPVADWQVH